MRTILTALAVLVPAAAWAADAAGPAVCVTQRGSILRREKPGEKWQYVNDKETLRAGDLLVGLPGAQLESRNRAVKLAFLTDFGDSPFPVIECAVVLHDTKDRDLDFTLDRGWADLVNIKDRGAATVRIRVHGEVFELTLKEPQTRVALELYGRWEPGVRFKADPKKKAEPAANLVVLVLAGSAEFKDGGAVQQMTA